MKTFHPFLFEDVDASAPHPPNTKYRVALGIEYWDDQTPIEVAKVQMVYEGLVAGRKSPSYPLGTDDLERVTATFVKLQQRGRHMPMTAERLQAFSPESPIVKAIRNDVRDQDMARVMRRLKAQPSK